MALEAAKRTHGIFREGEVALGITSDGPWLGHLGFQTISFRTDIVNHNLNDGMSLSGIGLFARRQQSISVNLLHQLANTMASLQLGVGTNVYFASLLSAYQGTG